MITHKMIVAKKRLLAEAGNQSLNAKLRSFFLAQDNDMIKYYLQQDLLKYMEGADISRMKLITLNKFVKAFLTKISHMYKTAPLVKHENSTKENEVKELLSEMDFYNSMQQTEVKTKLHNTILVASMYYKELDKMYFDNSFNAGTTVVVPYDGYELEPAIVYRHFIDENENDMYVVWNRITKDHYYVKGEIKVEGYIISGNIDRPEGFPKTGQAIFPFVTRRHIDQDYGFWQNGMDDLIEICRALNILLTIATDDTAQEAIRLLVLNFEPAGTKDGKGIKAGIRHPLHPVDPLPMDKEPTATITDVSLYNDDIIKLVDSLIEIVSGLEGIGNALKADLEKNLSGIAIRLRNEPILNSWQKDINTFRKNDLLIVEKAVEVSNHFREKQIKVDVLKDLELDYQQPQMVIDEETEYKLEKEKWGDGTSSPIQWLMKKNPELRHEEDAKKKIQENLKEYDELYGVAEIEIPEGE